MDDRGGLPPAGDYLLTEQILGDVRLLSADFGLQMAFDPASRLYAPELGGGASLYGASRRARRRA